MSNHVHFQVDPRLAFLLGEGYRSSEEALKELVDNAWDADATTVYIALPNLLTSESIIVRDDGTGMTNKEVQREYLVIANDRKTRKGERTQQKNRLVKGRKGIGKFAGLMAANIMDLETMARGVLTSLQIKKDDLLSAKGDLERINLPLEAVSTEPSKHGTTITLSSLNQSLAFPNPERLRQILMLEYGRQTDFTIYVNGDPLGIEDILGDSFSDETELLGVGKIKLRFTIADGWKPIKQSGIAIRVGGKIVGKPFLFGLDQHEHLNDKLLKRVYGEVEADGLEDVTTADWGAIIENSLAFQLLSNYIAPILQEKVEKAFKKDIDLAKSRLEREIKSRLEKLPEHRREVASKAIERVLQRFYGENSDRINVIASVVLDTLERDEYWAVIKEIEEAKHQDVETFADALQNFGLLDMALIARQATNRLKVLDEIEDLAKHPETLEKTMHTAIEKNLRWILGAEYALMASNKSLARIIDDYKDEKYAGDRANKRPDLLLCNDLNNRHLLIEFKRPSHTITRDDENQAEKYRDDLTPKFTSIDILLIGKERDKRLSSQYDRPDVKIMSYVDLLSRARTQLNWLLTQLQEDR